jgi:hypothetical protein
MSGLSIDQDVDAEEAIEFRRTCKHQDLRRSNLGCGFKTTRKTIEVRRTRVADHA